MIGLLKGFNNWHATDTCVVLILRNFKNVFVDMVMVERISLLGDSCHIYFCCRSRKYLYIVRYPVTFWCSIVILRRLWFPFLNLCSSVVKIKKKSFGVRERIATIFFSCLHNRWQIVINFHCNFYRKNWLKSGVYVLYFLYAIPHITPHKMVTLILNLGCLK